MTADAKDLAAVAPYYVKLGEQISTMAKMTTDALEKARRLDRAMGYIIDERVVNARLLLSVRGMANDMMIPIPDSLRQEFIERAMDHLRAEMQAQTTKVISIAKEIAGE